MPGLDDFKSRLTGGGARPNLFRCLINFPGGVGGSMELASFMIKAAQLPASTIAPIEVPYRGRKLKVAGDRTFEPWTITVLNDNGMEIRNAFERWMDLVNAHTANDSAFVGSNSLGYMQNMTVQQLDRAESIVKSYEFVGAFPTLVSAIDLNFETNDAIEEFTVDLNYQYWRSDTTN
jgi:hypothetical protein